MTGDIRSELSASGWVGAHIGAIRPGGHVLDVACGGGRHTRLAIAAGFRVTAVDRNLAGMRDLAGHPAVTLIEADLENRNPFPVAAGACDGVIVTNYLWRPILADIIAAVNGGGVLIYETYAIGQERIGRPTNPAFLLQPCELIAAVRHKLRIFTFEHVRLSGPDRFVQRIVAVGPEHDWASAASHL